VTSFIHLVFSPLRLIYHSSYIAKVLSLCSYWYTLMILLLSVPPPWQLMLYFCDLSADFALKDLGPLHYFLGIQVTCTADGLYLSQEKYATDLLRRARMIDCKPTVTPLSATKKLSMLVGGGERSVHKIPPDIGASSGHSSILHCHDLIYHSR
jgi:hypothetical protein